MAGCDGGATASRPPVVLPEEGEPLPARLSEYGLYPSAPDLTETGADALRYEPRWPLWSNGSDKERLLVLPEGSRGRAGRSDAGEAGLPEPSTLPVGSFFFKTFAFPVGAGQEPLPVETRVMRKTEAGWAFARYVWDEHGADARLLEDRLPVRVPVELPDGASFEHVVPTPLDCRTCHEAASDPVLGYDPLQLGLEEFEAPDSETRDIMGYVVGNCVHCHNGGDRENASFDLRPPVFLENMIDRPTASSASGIGIRVVPGEPERSVVWKALAGGDEEDGIKAMPPRGVQHVDEEAVERMRSWIERLPDWLEDVENESCESEEAK